MEQEFSFYRNQRWRTPNQNWHGFHQMHVVLRVIQIDAIKPGPQFSQFNQRLQIDLARLLHTLAEHDVSAVRHFAAAQIDVANVKWPDRLQLTLEAEGDNDEFDATRLLQI